LKSSVPDWKVYVNGEILPVEEAKVSPFDRGIEYGDGIMESIRCYEGRLFEIDAHINRLYRSAIYARINIPLSKAELKPAILNTVQANNFSHAHVKVIVTRGIEYGLGLQPNPNARPTVIIFCRPMEEKSALGKESDGFRLASVSRRKVPPACLDPRIKSTDFLPNILARAEAVDSGADEAVLLDSFGNVAECAAANIFIVKGDEICTPPASAALEGITRKAVIELARKVGYSVSEMTLTQYDIWTADEVFITGTAAGIAPIVEVDRRPIGERKVGPVTSRLTQEYRQALLSAARVLDDQL
jgi:branched-chain amino acid aminotransferase